MSIKICQIHEKSVNGVRTLKCFGLKQDTSGEVPTIVPAKYSDFLDDVFQAFTDQETGVSMFPKEMIKAIFENYVNDLEYVKNIDLDRWESVGEVSIEIDETKFPDADILESKTFGKWILNKIFNSFKTHLIKAIQESGMNYIDTSFQMTADDLTLLTVTPQ